MSKDLPNIHEPDYDDPKEPYAFFGLAAYYVQCFEQSLILLIVALKAISATPIAESSFEEVIGKLDRKTMGALIEQLSKFGRVDRDFAARLPDLLAKRNYLIHHFFERNADKWFLDDRKRAMLNELRELAQSFQDGNSVLESMYEPLWHKLGITEEVVHQELEKLKVRGRYE